MSFAIGRCKASWRRWRIWDYTLT